MSKKVLIVSGSPRKNGNSDILCDQFIKGAEEKGNITEKIYLKDKKIEFCDACYACRKTQKCIKKDDMQEIIDKIIDADVIVLATPVYFYSMDGQMKTMIDRTLPCYMKIRDKEFYFIVTAAADKEYMKRTIDSLCGFTDCLPESRIQGVVYGSNAWEIGDIKKSESMNKAYEFGFNV